MTSQISTAPLGYVGIEDLHHRCADCKTKKKKKQQMLSDAVVSIQTKIEKNVSNTLFK